jgi:hypothetical protein
MACAFLLSPVSCSHALTIQQRALMALAVAALLSVSSSRAFAQVGPSQSEEGPSPPPSVAARVDPSRPAGDGAGEPRIDHDPPLPPGNTPRPLPSGIGHDREPSAASGLYWIPRVLCFPLYVTSEFVVRRPLGALLTVYEKNHWQQRFYDFLTFGAHRQFGIFPTGRVDLGLRPSAGLFIFWKDIVGPSDLRLRATTGGRRWWTLDGVWRAPLTRQSDLAVKVAVSKRSDRAFFGFGPLSDGSISLYEETRQDLRLTYDQGLPPWSRLSAYAGQRWVAYDPGHASLGRSTLQDAIIAGRFPPPPALDGGLLALYTGAKVQLDTRGRRVIERPTSSTDFEHRSATGVVLMARIEQVAGVRPTRAASTDTPRTPHWLDYGASVLGSLDLTGTQRRIDLELLAEFTDPLRENAPVPFSEQVSLGGAQPLRGFRDHRLVDRSAAVATLSYRWPVWVSLDGALHYAVGNVFGERLSGFEPRLLRSSFGLGIDSAGSTDNPFEALLAFGTEPFAAGSKIDSVRFVFGTRAGF